jgi:hypothetical protein
VAEKRGRRMIICIDKEPLWRRIMFKIGLLRKISPPLTIKELVELANETREKQAVILINKGFDIKGGLNV